MDIKKELINFLHSKGYSQIDIDSSIHENGVLVNVKFVYSLPEVEASRVIENKQGENLCVKYVDCSNFGKNQITCCNPNNDISCYEQ